MILSLFLFGGCAFSENPVNTETAIKHIGTATGVSSALYREAVTEISSKETSPPTEIPTITPTEVPTITPTEMPSRTPTKAPTFTPKQSEELILAWVMDNGGCRLPCIWGFVPGETVTDARKSMLERFGSGQDYLVSRSDPGQNPGGIGYSITTEDELHISFSLNYFEKGGVLDRLSLGTRVVRENIPVFGEKQYNEILDYYSLGQILEYYGKPSEILVAAWPNDPFLKAPYDPFIVVLIYKEDGIIAEYVSPSERVDGKVHGCPTDSRISVRTYVAEENQSIEEIASVASGVEFNKSSYPFFKHIEEVAPLTLNEFYEEFKSSSGQICLDIVDMWIP